MTPDQEDYFLRGSEHVPNGQTRTKCCETCAFKPGPGTVRPEGVSPDDVAALSADLDGFMCHETDAQGRSFTCAGWAAHQKDRWSVDLSPNRGEPSEGK